MTYTIAKAGERCGLTAHTLRFYDKEGLLPFVDRSPSGVRIFKESDFDWLRIITCLKDTGMSIKKIREFVDWAIEGDATIGKRLEFIREHKREVEQQLEQMKAHLETIDYKLHYYETALEAGTTAIHKNQNDEKKAEAV